MTESEALEKSAIVVAALFPGWWKPGRIACADCDVMETDYKTFGAFSRDHKRTDGHRVIEIPPPNLLQAENSLRALKEMKEKHIGYRLYRATYDGLITSHLWTSHIHQGEADADTPEEALLLALYDLATKEKR